MTDRIYDRELECGCLISSDGGGGLIPCCYGYGCGKWFTLNGKRVICNEHHECAECVDQEYKCQEAWKKWMKTKDYKKHLREVKERN